MKRALFKGLTIVLAIAMPLGAVSAISDIDYEKSIGQIKGADTVNWVVEATSDGGYVVGGQTVACYRHKLGVVETASVKEISTQSVNDDEEEYEQTDLQKCIISGGSGEAALFEVDPDGKASETPVSMDELLRGSLVMNVCGLMGQSAPILGGLGDGLPVHQMSTSSLRLMDSDDSAAEAYSYELSCVNYIAKFKKSGVKEWLSIVRNQYMPVAVGEISDGYRMFTRGGDIITTDKTGTLRSIVNLFDMNAGYRGYIVSALVERDGSIVFTDIGETMIKTNAAGQIIKTSSSDNGAYTFPTIVPVSDGYIFTQETISDSYDNDTFPEMKIVKVDKNFNNATPIILKGKNGPIQVVVSSDKEDNMMALDDCDETQMSHPENITCRIASYDKNGNLIATTERGPIIESLAVFENLGLRFKDYTRYNSNSENRYSIISKVIKYNKSLKTEFEYAPKDYELIFDTAVLNDGSLVGVGFALKQSATYSVDGDINGVYFRLTPQQLPVPANNETVKKDTIKNPKTFDAGLTAIVILGGLSVFGVGLAVRKFYKNM